MKKIMLFLILLVGVGLTTMEAQTCKKSTAACSKKSTTVATSNSSHCGGSATAAAKLAALDESIETRTCAKSGNVSYVRKETNSGTGSVIFTSVEYDSELGKFVNMSPTAAKSCCKGAKAGCCASKMKVTEAAAEPAETKQVSHKGS